MHQAAQLDVEDIDEIYENNHITSEMKVWIFVLVLVFLFYSRSILIYYFPVYVD